MATQKNSPTTHVIFDFGFTIGDLKIVMAKFLEKYAVDFDESSPQFHSISGKYLDSFQFVLKYMYF